MSVVLWQRLSGPGCSRSNWLWFPGASHFGYTDYQPNYENEESEIDELSILLNGLRISHLLTCHQAELSIESETAVNHTMDLTNLNEASKMTKKEEIDAFSSKIIHMWTKTCSGQQHACDDSGPGGGRWFPLASWLSIMTTYSKMATGTKQVAVLVKNLTATPITVAKGVKIAPVIAANNIPQVGVSLGTLEKFDKMQGIQRAKMSVE